jgi:hypothetical protein
VLPICRDRPANSIFTNYGKLQCHSSNSTHPETAIPRGNRENNRLFPETGFHAIKRGCYSDKIM